MLLLGFSTNNKLSAANHKSTIGSRASAMGNASVTFQNAFSGFSNQAGLAHIKTISAGISYKNNFFLKETGLRAAALSLPLKSVGVVGLSVSSFGFDQYSENNYGLAFAKQFGKILSMAVQLNYLQTQFSEPYGSKGVFFGQFGIIGNINENLKIGTHIYNPTRSTLDNTLNDRVPTIIKTGLNYSFSKRLLTVFEIEKELDSKFNVKAGLEYNAYKKLAIRFGLNTLQKKVSFGIGINLKDWEIDLATAYHQFLGFVPNMSLRWQLNRNE